jgi:hypothetical protein
VELHAYALSVMSIDPTKKIIGFKFKNEKGRYLREPSSFEMVVFDQPTLTEESALAILSNALVGLIIYGAFTPAIKFTTDNEGIVKCTLSCTDHRKVYVICSDAYGSPASVTSDVLEVQF